MITVLTPTYNRKKELCNLYESLKRQINKNFVWFIVDDGSTDGTEKQVKEFQKENHITIRYEKKKNGRQAIAIRQALPVISHGVPTAEAALNVGCVSAHRKTWGEEECIILYNVSEEAAEVDLSAYDGWTLAASLETGKDPVKISGSTLKLPGYATAVLIPNA